MQAMPRATLEQARLGTTSAETIDTLLGTALTAHSLHDLARSHIFLQVVHEHKVLQVTVSALTMVPVILSSWYQLLRQIIQTGHLSFIILTVLTVRLLVEAYSYIRGGLTILCTSTNQLVVMPTKGHSIRSAFLTCVILGYGHLEADCMIEVFL
jgi:hypothetical protein